MSANKDQNRSDEDYQSLGLAIGMLLGAIVGAVIWIATDTFVFLPFFIGAGLSVGLAIGESMSREKE
jgi:hypothetical protein